MARKWGTELHIDAPGGPFTVTVRLPDGIEADTSSDAAVAACLLPAMRNDVPLEVDGPVSARLLGGIEVIQKVFCTWDHSLRPDDRWYHPVEVRSGSAVGVRRGPGRKTACFFTGGVDSFASAVAHRDQLDALIFVHGFDVPLEDQSLRKEVSARLTAAADALGLPLLEIETNLQAFGDSCGVGWPDYHGAALAAIALLLSPQFERVLIPATHTYAHLEGNGSHPLLDPLWSTEDLAVVHDGADATRIDKLRSITGEPAARQHLRVCWENRDGAYNCGRCEKCIRTGAAIRIAGAEGVFLGLEPPTLRAVASVRATGRASGWHDLRDELARTGANPKLRWAIDAALVRHQLRRWSWTGKLMR